jgi:hypothetical protein
MPTTWRKTIGAIVIGLVFAGFGIFILLAAGDMWNHHQVLLTRRRVPRLVTYAANRNEFILRCIALAAYGGFFFSMSLALVLGILIRIRRLGAQFFSGPYQAPGIATAIVIPPVLCFIVWFILQWFTWLYYP